MGPFCDLCASAAVVYGLGCLSGVLLMLGIGAVLVAWMRIGR